MISLEVSVKAVLCAMYDRYSCTEAPNRACHPGGHRWDYYLGMRSTSQVTATHLKMNWNENVLTLMRVSYLDAPEVAKMTTMNVRIDENFIKVPTYSFQCWAANNDALRPPVEIPITGCTKSCEQDNFQCSQRQKRNNHQNEKISVSVNETQLHQVATGIITSILGQSRAVMDFSGLLWALARHCIHWNYWFRRILVAFMLQGTDISIRCTECLKIYLFTM